MEIKYIDKIQTVEDYKKISCLDDTYKELDLIAYRWTFDDIANEKNFRPRALDPDHPKLAEIELECGGWSLSFFNSEESAIIALKKHTSDKKMLYKKLGTHVAKGQINSKDGRCGEITKHGHFECFEYQSTNFHNQFSIIKQVCP